MWAATPNNKKINKNGQSLAESLFSWLGRTILDLQIEIPSEIKLKTSNPILEDFGYLKFKRRVLKYCILPLFISMFRCARCADHPAVRAWGGLERHEWSHHLGLRVHPHPCRPDQHSGTRGQMVLQQRSRSRVPVDTRPETSGLGYPQGKIITILCTILLFIVTMMY